jgi:hypothetical protein
MTSTQVQVLFHAALEDQGLLDPATASRSVPTGARWTVTTMPVRSWSPGRTFNGPQQRLMTCSA